MSNECLRCKKNCCDHFLITFDLFNKNWWESEGKFQFTMFKKDFITGRFHCDNFDRERGICTDYENRPIVCRNTGNEGMYPSDKCLLRKREMARV